MKTAIVICAKISMKGNMKLKNMVMLFDNLSLISHSCTNLA